MVTVGIIDFEDNKDMYDAMKNNKTNNEDYLYKSENKEYSKKPRDYILCNLSVFYIIVFNLFYFIFFLQFFIGFLEVSNKNIQLIKE